MTDDLEYYKILSENTADYTRVCLTVHSFRDVEYLSIRKYYLDFEEVWSPSSEGISIPLTMESSSNLFVGLLEILSKAEARDLILKHFSPLLEETLK